MSKPARRDPPEAVTRVQIEASDPTVSAWVAANAGSGKTHVLAQRVIRLMLAGVDPARLLCITFTKAAAANMANRVFGTLAEWTRLDDDGLDAAIARMSNIEADAKIRALARRLFATALETPGGLKVQTIHAFCTRLLRQFPFESDVAARFEVLDEAAETQLLEQLTLAVLLEASARPESALGEALSIAIASASDRVFQEAAREAIRKRHLLQAWIERTGDIGSAVAELCAALGIDSTDTATAVERDIIEGPNVPTGSWALTAQILARGSKSDKDQAKRLEIARTSVGPAQVATYLEIFFTGQGDPRSRIATTAIEANHPQLCQKLRTEQARLPALVERQRAVAGRDRTVALLRIVDAVLTRYRQEKESRGLLDYDDLIDRTLTLLTEDRAGWVHFKLDRGIDHVLVDEAQDTSPRQWEIIRRLVAEFTAGEGARQARRTIFAVGDEKQSIFSFQGADPKAFDTMRRFFAQRHADVGLSFVERGFAHSFRSGENLLGAVDHVFHPRDIARSITSDADGMPPHIALPDAAPGLVEIWPTEKPDERREIEAWDAPFDEIVESSAVARLAKRIARNAALMIERGARAGDILVLVRQRGGIFDSVIRALKDQDVPVAGADRLMLTEHIAVMDLMALADALLLPDDDLALATVLKSPLFGLDDDDLFALAWQRRGPLRSALREKAGEAPRFAAAREALDRMAEAAQRQPPFAFYAHLLGPEGGRRKFLARLGPEANDALDEFLNLALDFERRETPSLQGFMAWLRTARAEVKRDMEITRDEVRVMTVHGAKGLEAPIVILADTITPPEGPPQRQPRLLPLSLPLPARAAMPMVWAGNKASNPSAVNRAREQSNRAAEDEHRRLLYVAMTRAAHKLIVASHVGPKGPPPGCWYTLIEGALADHCEEAPADDGQGTVLRFRKTRGDETFRSAASHSRSTIAAPAWLARAAPLDEVPAIVAPSQADDATLHPRKARAGARAAAERAFALARGSVMHRLLQSLPDIPLAARAAATDRYLNRAAKDFSEAERAAIASQIAAVLGEPRFAPLFAPGSLAEVPIVGRVARPDRSSIQVSGQVDRLIVTDESVVIADYKSNSPAPRTLADVPPGYVVQLALYRAVLERLYPGRTVRAALIWTDVPDLMEISSDALSAALARVTTA